MLHVLSDDLPVQLIRAHSLLIDGVVETIERRITIRAVGLAIRKIRNKNTALDGKGDKKTRSPKPEGSQFQIKPILIPHLHIFLIDVIPIVFLNLEPEGE